MDYIRVKSIIILLEGDVLTYDFDESYVCVNESNFLIIREIKGDKHYAFPLNKVRCYSYIPIESEE